MSALDGWRVLVPRPPGRGSSSLVSLLAREGAVAQAVPLIAIDTAGPTSARSMPR